MKILPRQESILINCGQSPHIRSRLWEQFWQMALEFRLDRFRSADWQSLDTSEGLGQQLLHISTCPDCLSMFSNYWLAGTMHRDSSILGQAEIVDVCSHVLDYSFRLRGCGKGSLSHLVVELANYGYPLAEHHLRQCRQCTDLNRGVIRQAITQMLRVDAPRCHK